VGRVSRRDLLVDIAAGVALIAFMVGVTPVSRTGPHARALDAVGYILLVVVGAAAGFSRRRPVIAYVLAVVPAGIYLLLSYPGWPVYIGAIVGLLGLVAETSPGSWVPAGIVGGLVMAIGSGRPEGWQPARMAVVFALWSTVMVMAGEAAARRARRADARARQQLLEERLRIARELHDVLSHSLATIHLQAGVGLRLLDGRPEQAKVALAGIRSVSADGLVHARGALSAMRQSDDPGADGHSLTLGDLGSLVTSVRAAGVKVDMDVDPAARASLPTEAAAYRVTQEALTNVMRHAGIGAEARVSVQRCGDRLELEVRDNGCGPSVGTGGGHGLAGMHERVAVLGGELHAAPGLDGGFTVRASLPMGTVP
jgi:signal transduction histidine kinase